MAGRLSFQLEMLGGAEVLTQLREIVALQRQLASAGSNAPQSILGGASGVTQQQVQQIKEAARSVSGLKKEVQSLGTASAQGVSETGKLWLNIFSRRGGKAGGFTPSETFIKNNPHLAAMLQPKDIPTGHAAMQHPEIRRIMRDRAAFYRDMTFGMMPLMNPGSPWGTLFGMRQIFGAMMTQTGQGMIGKVGASGVGGAGLVAGGLVAGLTAIGFALKGFQAAIQGAKSAIQSAFGIYTGAAQQGLSTQFFARRQALSGMLGVQGNPNNVFYFGKAIQELDQRIGAATRTIASNAPVLTQVDINWKVMKLDLEALFSTIAIKVVPAINLFVAALDTLINHLGQYLKGLTGALFGGPAGAAYFAGIMGQIASDPRIQGFFKNMSPLNVMAKQLPASQWEHMGLVIGGGFQQKSMEYQRQTAQGVNRLVGLVQGNTKKGTNDYYLGYNPFVAAP